MISLKNVDIGYELGTPIIKEFSLEVDQGEFVLMSGATGSGKSTVLHAIAGLIPHHYGGFISGDIAIDGIDVRKSSPANLSHLVGYVAQNPLHGFVSDTVADEIAFALESHGVATEEMEKIVRDISQRLGIYEIRERPLHHLSAGEAQKVAIAAAAVMRPRYLVLDEPTSALDEESTETILNFLREYAQECAVIMSEHRLEKVRSLITREINLSPTQPQQLTPVTRTNITVIYGPNGSGKTTYLNSLVAGKYAHYGYVPQNPGDILITQSVLEECSLPQGSKAREILADLDPTIQDQVHPRDLSEGQKLCLALAVTLGRSPQHVVLDEPTRGLDAALKFTIIDMLCKLDIPLTIATHDKDLIATFGTTTRSIMELR